jgi:hypothetical protein
VSILISPFKETSWTAMITYRENTTGVLLESYKGVPYHHNEICEGRACLLLCSILSE